MPLGYWCVGAIPAKRRDCWYEDCTSFSFLLISSQLLDIPLLDGVAIRPGLQLKVLETGMTSKQGTGGMCACLAVSDSLQLHGLYSLPGSPVPGISQAKVLVWVAISSSRGPF